MLISWQTTLISTHASDQIVGSSSTLTVTQMSGLVMTTFKLHVLAYAHEQFLLIELNGNWNRFLKVTKLIWDYSIKQTPVDHISAIRLAMETWQKTEENEKRNKNKSHQLYLKKMCWYCDQCNCICWSKETLQIVKEFRQRVELVIVCPPQRWTKRLQDDSYNNPLLSTECQSKETDNTVNRWTDE